MENTEKIKNKQLEDITCLYEVTKALASSTDLRDSLAGERRAQLEREAGLRPTRNESLEFEGHPAHVLVYSDDERFDRLAAAIHELHSYEVPEKRRLFESNCSPEKCRLV